MFQQELLQALRHRRFDHALDLGGHEFVLGLRGEFRIRQLDRQDGGQALAGIIASGGDFFLFGGEFLLDISVERARQGGAITRQVRAAVLLRNVVGVAEHAFLIGIVPLHGDFHLGVAVARLKPEHGVVDRRLAAVQMGDEGLQAAFVLENLRFLVALVIELDAQARIEEGQFAQALGESFINEGDVGENLRARLEAQGGAAFIGVADGGERRLRLAQTVFLTMDFAVAPDGEFQKLRQGVDHRHADAMQTAGDLVGAVVEFAAGMQHGHDDFGCRAALLGVNIHGNTAAVVGDGDGFVGMDGDDHTVAMTRQGLIDGVVHHFEHHVVQAAAIIGVTDVHARPLAYRVEAL